MSLATVLKTSSQIEILNVDLVNWQSDALKRTLYIIGVQVQQWCPTASSCHGSHDISKGNYLVPSSSFGCLNVGCLVLRHNVLIRLYFINYIQSNHSPWKIWIFSRTVISFVASILVYTGWANVQVSNWLAGCFVLNQIGWALLMTVHPVHVPYNIIQSKMMFSGLLMKLY